MLRMLLCCSLLFAGTLFAQEKSYSICVAPFSAAKIRKGCIPGQLCGKGKIELRIDKGPRINWPEKGSLLLPKLPADSDHKFTIYVGGIPRESFRLRKKDFDPNEPKLCFFISDLYLTLQLWERKRCPWCTCE
jgi:hypothetical protein